jgi:glycosyltransferase involved in cell wall biosynthesis
VTFILLLEYDLSLNTGYSINERESTLALLNRFPEEIIVVAPRPQTLSLPEHPSFEFVTNHRRFNPVRYSQFLLECWHRLRRLIAGRQIAAVVLRPGPSALLPYLLARRGVPLILKTAAAYEMSLPHGAATTWTNRTRWAVNKKLFSRIYLQCLGGDTVSSVYADWFAEAFDPAGGKRLALIPNGANGQFFQRQGRTAARQALKLERFDHLVGYVGNLGPLRHLDLLLEAMTDLRDVSRLGLLLVGDGPARPLLEAKARQLGVGDRVIFLGSRSYDEMPTVISALDVAVDLTRVPMRVGDEVRYGSFSQKIPQYLACGVPVVAWDTCDTQMLAAAGVGRLVIGDTPDRVAAAVRSLIRPPAEDELMRMRARAFFERELSAEVVAQRRFALWTDLVDGTACAA